VLELHDRLGGARARRWRAALALAAAPTAGLCAWAYVRSGGQAPREYQAPAPEARASLDWARGALRRDAVLVERAIEQGEATTLAVDARRSLLWGSATMGQMGPIRRRPRAAPACRRGIAAGGRARARGARFALASVERSWSWTGRAPEEPRAGVRAPRGPAAGRLACSIRARPGLLRYPVAP